MTVGSLDLRHSYPVDDIASPWKRFSDYLSSRRYDEAAKMLKTTENEWSLQVLRNTLVDHLNSKPYAIKDCSSLLDAMLAYDAEKMLLSNEWIGADAEVFKAVISSYTKALEAQGCREEKLVNKLSRELAGLLTYPKFRLDQATVLIEHLPGFDPRKPSNPSDPHAPSYLQWAKACHLDAQLIEYLEAMTPPSPVKLNLSSINFSEFCGVAACKDRKVPQVTDGYTPLSSALEVYAFLEKQDPSLEGDENFFKKAIAQLVQEQNYSQEEALKIIKQDYQRGLAAYSTVQTLLERHDITVHAAHDMSLDHAISDGHDTVGATTFERSQVVCKFQGTAYNLASIVRVADFVTKSRKLWERVPNVIETLPDVILNKTKEGKVEVGFLMKKASGQQLRKISHLSLSEKKAIADQFATTVRSMLANGYALYDFEDDNVFWDGKNLTFIDLSPAGFKPEALANADTASVIFRMSAMLDKINSLPGA